MSDIWKKARELREQKIQQAAVRTARATVSFEPGTKHLGDVMSVRVAIEVPLNTSYKQVHAAVLDAHGKAMRRWKALEQGGADRMPALMTDAWTMWHFKDRLVVGWEGFFDDGYDISDLRSQGWID